VLRCVTVQRGWVAQCGLAWLFRLAPHFWWGMDSPTNKARIWSGALMVFYLIPFFVLYSATKVQTLDESRHCLNGHHVSPLAKCCEECGARCAFKSGGSVINYT
jgi:hypothetical protein